MAALNAFENTVIGNTAVTTAQFILTTQTDITSAYVTYTLLDDEGTVFSTGNGSVIDVLPKANAKVVQSSISLVVPSTLPVNVLGTTYQVRITLHLISNNVESYSNLTVLPLELTYEGAGDIVDIKGNSFDVSIVIDGTPSAINPLLYYGNDPVPITTALIPSSPLPTSDGNLYTTTVNTTDQAIYPTLNAYALMWQYILNGKNNTEVSSVWIVTPSILMAVKDLMATINKARTGLRDKPTFSVTDALTYLRLGADLFNGFGDPTAFTFTNATGAVRGYWLKFSEVEALRAQYLYEGESSFDFQGQAISLNVDRTQYYEGLASAIESQLESTVRPFKATLSKRGNINGDGNVDPTKLRAGALGSVGITYSPVSRIGFGVNGQYLGLGWGGQRSLF